jgi:hypothetical protein
LLNSNNKKVGAIMGKQRGRQKRTIDEIKSAYKDLKDAMQLDLKLMVDSQTGRVSVLETTPDGELSPVISNASGNSFIDICKGTIALACRAGRLPRLAGSGKAPTLEVSETTDD